jgi:hypothetical protein
MCRRDPGGDRLARLLGDLDLDRPLGLLLHDNRAGCDPTALDHIVNMEPDQITPAQLAVQGEVEQRKFPGSMAQLQPNPDRSDLLSFSGGFWPSSLPLFHGTSALISVSINRSFIV